MIRLNYHASVPEPQVRLNPGGQTGPFAVVDFGDSYFSLETPREAEAFAAVFTEAARLLREAQDGAPGQVTP